MSIATFVNQKYGYQITFLSQNDNFKKIIIIDKEFNIYLNKDNADEENFISNAINHLNGSLLFIDKLYNYSVEFIKGLKNRIPIIMFHNVCDGGYFSDVFILPSVHTNENIINDRRWNNKKVKFLQGSKYVVLNNEIINLKNSTNKSSDSFNVVITTGGSDPSGVTIKIIDWLNYLNGTNIKIKVLIGKAFKNAHLINEKLPYLSDFIKVVPFDVQELINADLTISTFGITTYELLYLEKPNISIGHIEHNAKCSALMEKRYGVIKNIGNIKSLKKEYFLEVVNSYISNAELRMGMINNINDQLIIDGKGVERIAKTIFETCYYEK